MVNCLNFEIRIKSSVFDGLKRTTVSPFVYAVFPSHDVYMEVAMCIRLIVVWFIFIFVYRNNTPMQSFFKIGGNPYDAVK